MNSDAPTLKGFQGGQLAPTIPSSVVNWLLVAWLLGMVGLPILLWTIGPVALPWAVSATVCILAMVSILTLASHGSWPTLARIVATVLIGAWFIEWLGSTTGFPFSHYDYTDVLQPQLGGVPVLIPLAWLMMLPSTWVVGQLIAPSHRLRQALVSAGALTAWDLFLDPQMVGWNFWQWASHGGYFGIPWINFAGWFAAGLVLTLVAYPPRLPALPLLWVYTITWLLQSIGLALFWSMPGPAACGFIAMGLFVVLAWRQYFHLRTTPNQSNKITSEEAEQI